MIKWIYQRYLDIIHITTIIDVNSSVTLVAVSPQTSKWMVERLETCKLPYQTNLDTLTRIDEGQPDHPTSNKSYSGLDHGIHQGLQRLPHEISMCLHKFCEKSPYSKCLLETKAKRSSTYDDIMVTTMGGEWEFVASNNLRSVNLVKPFVSFQK
jgi:hypothetical protein